MPQTPVSSFRSKLKEWIHKAGGILAPPFEVCSYCRSHTRAQPNELGLCEACFSQIPWIINVECDRCGRAEQCPDCTRRQQTYFVRNRSAVKYDTVMKDLLALYKYRGDERLQTIFSTMLVHAFRLLLQSEKLSSEDFHCITYVPVNEERLEERGFNQAERFATGLADKLRLPVRCTLIRTRNTPKQSFKSRQERLSDLQDAFALHPSVYNDPLWLDSPSQRPIKIILVDDVYTTGSTLNQCSRLLASYRNTQVYGLTWAR